MKTLTLLTAPRDGHDWVCEDTKRAVDWMKTFVSPTEISTRLERCRLSYLENRERWEDGCSVELFDIETAIPLMDGKQVATVQKQKASWMEQDQTMLLDREWETKIGDVADAFTQLLKREDLNFPFRKGLSEVWP